jgi:uncharacterized protein
MRSAWFSAAVAILACIRPVSAQELVAPADSSKASRQKEMSRCLAVAEGKLSGSASYSRLGIWDDLKKEVLGERNTGGFVYTTQMSRRSAPVANDEGYPARRESLFASADPLSDRYVICLLSAGYRWKDSPRSYFDQVQELAQAGRPPAQAEMGLLLRSFDNPARRIDHNEFVAWTRKAAEQQYPIAQFNLAYAYTNGEGVARDEAEALRWMRAAAEKGYERAKPVLGRQDAIAAKLQSIRADTKDLEADRSAAEKGEARAQFALGARYEDGRGVDRDMKSALEWYRKSAEQGYARAQGYLGVIYDKGRGVKQDEAEAARWYRKAADQGDAQSQYNLGMFYLYGHGVEKNRDDARAWFERAQTSGFPPAAGALKDFF